MSCEGQKLSDELEHLAKLWDYFDAPNNARKTREIGARVRLLRQPFTWAGIMRKLHEALARAAQASRKGQA